MPRLTGPLFSLGARNTLGGTITYSSWRGVNYARTRVTPSNPQTADQTEVRNIFRNLSLIWDYSGTGFRAPWTARATGQPFTNRNLLVKENVAVLQGQANLTNFVFSPGAGGAPPPTISSVTNGVGQLTVNMTAPTAPTGWTITRAWAAAILSFDAGSAQTGILMGEASDAAAAYAPVITGLTAALHRVGAWLEWLKPDGTTAYSTAATSVGTPT